MNALTIGSNQYRCAVCEQVFNTGWSDAEAIAERERVFPNFAEDACEIVCDDCYKTVMKDLGLT